MIKNSKIQQSVKIVLTPNSRLSRTLKQDISHKALPLSSWLMSLYQDLLFEVDQCPTLLSPDQELLIWQNIISQSPFGQQLLQVETTAKAAMQAYAQLRSWCVSLTDLAAHCFSLDTKAFQQWAHEFEQHTHTEQSLSQACLIDWIIEHINTSYVPQQLTLINFDDITPQTQKLLNRLSDLGCKLDQQQITLKNQTEAVITTNDLQTEIITMARWAKAMHQQNPTAKIQCIVPNLTQIRPEIQRCFAEVFSPAAQFNPEYTQAIYNISGGYALSSAPIIHCALQLLNLNAYKIDYQQLSSLLTTAFINGFTIEAQNRAYADKQFRNFDETKLSWRLILKQLEKHWAEALPNLLQQCSQWHELRHKLPKKQTLLQWRDSFYQLLTSIGWPGERTLNSREHQEVNRFYKLLNQLPSLLNNERTFNYQEVLRLLQQLCNNTVFEIETEDGPIQVLGLLEAAGITADYCWFMHLDDKTWPEAAKPNPLLPYQLQQTLNMPHSSAQRELDYCQTMQQRLKKSCSHIIYSYHQYDGDKQLFISPLIKHTIQIEQVAQCDYTPIIMQITNSAQCHYVDDQQAPAITKNENVPGGTQIFKNQAACPFRAFATHRLHAQGLTTPSIGLDAAQRGSLLHSCLDNVWATLKTQAGLLNCDNEQLAQIIEQAIAKAFDDCFPYQSNKITLIFKQLEFKRLTLLLQQWLEHEKQRPAFKVVAHEKQRRAEFHGLNIKLKIDRIDQLDNGERLLIDYKTSKTNVENWYGSRPREPQLPLYSVIENDIDAICFAQVRIDELKFNGISANDTYIRGINSLANVKDDIPETWQQLQQQWHTVLQQLAQDFLNGNAVVDPLDETTCQYCDLHSLCRIGETA